jgi:hypothetical protein
LAYYASLESVIRLLQREEDNVTTLTHENGFTRTAAERLAQSLANITRVPTYVIEQNGRHLIQDDADIDCYGGRADVVATFQPTLEVNWNSGTASATEPPPGFPEDDDGSPDGGGPPRAFPTCRACNTSDFPPSAILPGMCIGCANARHFDLPNRFAAIAEADRRRAQTKQSREIEARLTVCAYCQGIHHIQNCPMLRNAVFAPTWVGADLGRGLCQMRWRNASGFVQLLESATPARLVEYAESYIAFIRANRPESTLTTHEVLKRWTPLIGGEPAMLERAA